MLITLSKQKNILKELFFHSLIFKNQSLSFFQNAHLYTTTKDLIIILQKT